MGIIQINTLIDRMKCLIVLAVFVAAASASSFRRGAYYGGLYPGYCPLDGYYYYDTTSYIQCDNGKHAIRACAPGTKNGPASSYKANTYYSSGSVFCDLFADAEVAEEEAPAEEAEEHPAPAKLPPYALPNAGR